MRGDGPPAFEMPRRRPFWIVASLSGADSILPAAITVVAKSMMNGACSRARRALPRSGGRGDPFRSAVRHHQAAVSGAAGRDQGNHSFTCRFLRRIPPSSNMFRTGGYTRPRSQCFSPFGMEVSSARCAAGWPKPKCPSTVVMAGVSRTISSQHCGRPPTGYCVTDVVGHPDHAVGVDAGEVAVDQRVRHAGGDVFGCAPGAENAPADLTPLFGAQGNVIHGSFPFGERSSRLTCDSAAMRVICSQTTPVTVDAFPGSCEALLEPRVHRGRSPSESQPRV